MNVGDRVNRKENKQVVGAIIKQVVEALDNLDNNLYLIEYDEGGEGWWYSSSLELVNN